MTNMRDKIKGLLIAYEGYGFPATADAILALVRDEPMTKLEELKAARAALDAAYAALDAASCDARDAYYAARDAAEANYEAAYKAAYVAYPAELKKTKEQTND